MLATMPKLRPGDEDGGPQVLLVTSSNPLLFSPVETLDRRNEQLCNFNGQLKWAGKGSWLVGGVLRR